MTPEQTTAARKASDDRLESIESRIPELFSHLTRDDLRWLAKEMRRIRLVDVEKDVEVTELKRQLAVTQYERDLCADGSPLARFAELYCGHDPLSGKPAELAVMERIAELERENERLKTHSTGLKCALEALRWSNHPEPCWCAVPEKDCHDNNCMAARSALATP